MKRDLIVCSTLLLFVFIILIGGCSDSEGERSESASATSVTAAEVQTRDLSDAFTVSSEVIAYRRSYVAARIEGFIEEVNYEEGESVSRGDVLARIDTRRQQTDLRRARANLIEATDILDRTERLYERDAATRAELLSARRNFEQAESDVERLELETDFGSVTAPISGVVTSRLVEPGNNVSVNERMFTVTDMDLLVIRPGVSELNLRGLSEGEHVDVHLDVYPDRTFRGSIRRIFPSVDAASGLFTVEVELLADDDKPVVRPGFLARVRFAADDRREVTSVPSEAVAERNGDTYLFKLNEDEDAVELVPVRVGIQRDGFAEITEGIEPGARVAAANLDVLDDGSRVRVVGTFRRHGFRN
jgi:membrane fusion protein, multidrug efflux system